jgi:pimeloyl-ACP methyl ester carboxylesterase
VPLPESRQWRKLGQRLAPTHDVLAPDLIGYGGDPWPPGKPFHFGQDVERLAGLLDRPADVVGHSYGGLLALQLALAQPERVRSLALYEPVPCIAAAAPWRSVTGRPRPPSRAA